MNVPRLLYMLMCVSMLLSGVGLSACNTIEGVGRDIEAAGDAIEDEADERD